MTGNFDSMLSTGNKKLDDSAPGITGLEYKTKLLLNMQNTLALSLCKGHLPFLIDMADTAREGRAIDSGKR